MEREEYVGVQSTDTRESKERDDATDLLEQILDRDNLNKVYKRVKSNHGAPGIDGMTIEEVLPWLKEHKDELVQSLLDESFKPSPVRRKAIPNPDGGERMLGIPTVIDRMMQQAIAQKLQPIFEPLFSDGSYGYRPGRSGQQAMQRVKKYADEGYIYVVEVDLSNYFDTINHELLLNLLRKHVKDSVETS
ncbi:MAG: reverse transcriptase domain-containing protein [Clostridiaceae bacterium]